MQQMINLTMYFNIMKWINCYYIDYSNRQWERLVKHKFERFCATRGAKDTARYVKLSRLALTKYLSQEQLPRPFGISLNRHGLPSFFSAEICKRISEGDKMTITYVLTVLQFSRLILGDPKSFSTQSIEDKFTGYIPFNQASVALTLRRMGITSLDTEFKHFKWIGTSGPNGLSILRSFEDNAALPDDLRKDLYLLAGEEFRQVCDSLKGFWSAASTMFLSMFKVKAAKSSHLRKLSIKADKEAKSRPFAIFEYISQSALQPLHDSTYKALKSLPQDCTFDQNKGFRDVMYGGYTYFASFDLKSATDRFPIQVQEMVLNFLIGQEKSQAWCRIMTKYPFKTPDGRLVYFNTGQPLGAKSSWAIFSLSHHFIVWYCAMLLDIAEPQYKLLGDDIVIMDKRLADKYLEVMTQLGVEISPTKTHQGTTLFEFAKRFCYLGSEVTQFPITALVENITNYTLMSAVLSVTVPERGFIPLFIQSNSPSYLDDLLSIGFSDKKRLLISLKRKIQLISLLPSRVKPYMVNLSDLMKVGSVAGMPTLTLEQVNAALRKAVVTVKEREITKLINSTTKWNISVQTMLSQMIFLPIWGLVTRPHRAYIPIIASLDAAKDDCEVTLKALQEEQEVLNMMSLLDENPIKPTPQLKGLAPVRPKEQVTRSRSALLKPFLNELKSIQDK